jgi:hypothetical protein
MTIQYWISGTSGDWSTAADWVSGVVPSSTDDAVISTTSNGMTVNGTAVANLLTLDASVLTLAGMLTLGTSLTVNDGAQFRLIGGTLSAQSISSNNNGSLSGSGTVSGAVSGQIDITATGGILKVQGSLAADQGHLYIGSGATLELSNTAPVAAPIYFQGSPATLKLDAATMPTNVIVGFAPGDTIDLAGVAFSSTGTVTLASGNVLQIVEGGSTYNLHLNTSQNYSEDSFALSSDGTSGTDITVSVPLETTEAPHLAVSGSLSVHPGGSIPMGITATPVDNDDTVSITIKGVPSYETITAGPGEIVTHKGSTYTITSTIPGASITDLMLTSTYKGKGTVTSTLTVTASNTTSGETATSHSMTVNVTDPPILTTTNDSKQGVVNLPADTPPPSSFGLTTAQETIGGSLTGGGAPPNSPPGLDHVVALFNQFAAGFAADQHGGPISNPLSQVATNEEQFLTHPHHG